MNYKSYYGLSGRTEPSHVNITNPFYGKKSYRKIGGSLLKF